MKKFNIAKIFGSLLMALTIIIALPTMASAHCDTMDGPTAKADEAESLPIIPWSLAGVFFITTITSVVIHHRKASK
ncbi:hypothetical protein [Clostridium estertheticum]|uniref:hypothetical protein n=1 Tax=Clostridium estertheticum TaxID=238834 RepID=UPI001CF37BAD|nr:hypothetical protein [Clostridium estertheticum]MCB2339051.1 hypothetical protein [Clostridium estertheticum]